MPYVVNNRCVWLRGMYVGKGWVTMWYKVVRGLVVSQSCFPCLVAKSCLTLLQPQGLYPTRLLCLWDFPGKNTGVGCHFLLQGIFLTQRLNPNLLHWQMDSLPLSHLGSPLSQTAELKSTSIIS